MRTLTTILTGALICSNLLAQGVITRHNAGQSYFYYDGNIQTVFEEANGALGVDTIILGGGTYNLGGGDLHIQSQVVLIGTGIHPDSSLAYNNNGPTQITGNVNSAVILESNASGSELHGILITNSGVGFGTSGIATTNVDNVKFFRCRITGTLSLGFGVNGSQANDTYIHECVLGNVNISHSQNTIIRNSSLYGLIDSGIGEGTLIEHNLIFNWASGTINGPQFEKNVFVLNSGAPVSLAGQSTFLNNVFVGSGAGFNVTFNGPVNSGNVIRFPLSGGGALAAFPSTTASSYTAFDFYADYTLNPNVPANVQDAGIFGGGDPWKPGSVPFNPHWRELTTPTGTSNGALQGVTIKATAQQD